MSAISSLRFVPLLLCVLSSAVFAEDQQLKVEPQNIPNGLTFWTTNNNPWPMTGTVAGKLQNLNANKELPYDTVLPPQQRKSVVIAHAADSSQAYRAEVSVRARPGNAHARSNPKVRYRFPFRSGESFKVAQAFHGAISHTGKFEFAVDFMMPEGTVVCAAREGVVADVLNDFQEGRWDPALEQKANMIQIVHDDGTVAFYGHLQYHGATVSRGQRVNAGDPIGHSGRTGMIRAAHLHFHIEVPIGADTFRTIAFKFDGPKPRGIEPQKDETYTAP